MAQSRGSSSSPIDCASVLVTAGVCNQHLAICDPKVFGFGFGFFFFFFFFFLLLLFVAPSRKTPGFSGKSVYGYGS